MGEPSPGPLAWRPIPRNCKQRVPETRLCPRCVPAAGKRLPALLRHGEICPGRRLPGDALPRDNHSSVLQDAELRGAGARRVPGAFPSPAALQGCLALAAGSVTQGCGRAAAPGSQTGHCSFRHLCSSAAEAASTALSMSHQTMLETTGREGQRGPGASPSPTINQLTLSRVPKCHRECHQSILRPFPLLSATAGPC